MSDEKRKEVMRMLLEAKEAEEKSAEAESHKGAVELIYIKVQDNNGLVETIKAMIKAMIGR